MTSPVVGIHSTRRAWDALADTLEVRRRPDTFIDCGRFGAIPVYLDEGVVEDTIEFRDRDGEVIHQIIRVGGAWVHVAP